MKNTILSVFAGIVAAIFTTFLSEKLLSLIFPLPSGVDETNFEAISKYIENEASIGMFLGLLFTYTLAALIGAGVSAYLTNTTFAHKKRNGYIVGGVVAALVIYNFAMISHPVWFELLSLLFIFGGTLLGIKQGIERSISKS